MRQRARDGGADELIGRGGDRHRLRHADQDQQGRQQKPAADPEHAREKSHRRPKDQENETVQRDRGDRQINVHESRRKFLLAGLGGSLQPRIRENKALSPRWAARLAAARIVSRITKPGGTHGRYHRQEKPFARGRAQGAGRQPGRGEKAEIQPVDRHRRRGGPSPRLRPDGRGGARERPGLGRQGALRRAVQAPNQAMGGNLRHKAGHRQSSRRAAGRGRICR